MRSRHPFGWLTIVQQKRAFPLLFVLTMLVMASLQLLGTPLQTESAPAGIVSFEFAGELSVAQWMIDSWGSRGQVYAGLNLGLDYLFLFAYASAIGLGCVLVAQSLTQHIEFLSMIGTPLAWGQIGAALLDAVENYALIRFLLGTELGIWPTLARWCAVPKFLLVAAGLLYVIIGAIIIVAMKARANHAK